MSTRCSECAHAFTIESSGVCVPCQEGDNTRTRTRTRNQDQASSASLRSPGPGVIGDDGPELWRLIEAHHAGELKPCEVVLGSMPSWAGGVMRGIAEHLALLIGLRLAVGDDRPIPYATSMAVKEGVANDKGAASKALGALVRAGVIEHVGNLPPIKPGLDGTKLYKPPGGKS